MQGLFILPASGNLFRNSWDFAITIKGLLPIIIQDIFCYVLGKITIILQVKYLIWQNSRFFIRIERSYSGDGAKGDKWS